MGQTDKATVGILADLAVVETGSAGEHGGELVAVPAGSAHCGIGGAGETGGSTGSAEGAIGVYKVAGQTGGAGGVGGAGVAVG